MSNYLIKIGNLYYAGTHDYTAEQGYLDKRHPRVLIKLNKFDFNATQFASEKYAREAADKLRLKCKVVKSAEQEERDRRALLHEFNQFKNERNDGWTPNWKDFNMSKYFVAADSDRYLKSMSMYVTDSFVQFGYFRNYKDCMDAIEKFGDRIKKLYID